MNRWIVALITGACVAATATPARAAVHDCSRSAGPTVTVTSARHMSCARAAKVMRRHHSSISKHFRTTHYGFKCRRYSGGRYGGGWRCTKKAKAFRFSFGD